MGGFSDRDEPRVSAMPDRRSVDTTVPHPDPGWGTGPAHKEHCVRWSAAYPSGGATGRLLRMTASGSVSALTAAKRARVAVLHQVLSSS